MGRDLPPAMQLEGSQLVWVPLSSPALQLAPGLRTFPLVPRVSGVKVTQQQGLLSAVSDHWPFSL